MLNREFYNRDVVQVARDMPGKLLVHETPTGRRSGVIVETEAYNGVIDDGSHAFPQRCTPRTEIMFGDGGFAYVYLIYGMYHCFNVVAGEKGYPSAVLVRALEPVEGVSEMLAARGCKRLFDIASGPGKLCIAMGIGSAENRLDLVGGRLFLEDYKSFSQEEIGVSPRINIDYAENSKSWPWRFFVKDSPFVSKVPKRYREAAGD